MSNNPLAIDDAAHVVQLALTPIFLLSGIASLLNVFSTRLGRIADQVDKLDNEDNPSSRRLARLRLRSTAQVRAPAIAASKTAMSSAVDRSRSRARRRELGLSSLSSLST